MEKKKRLVLIDGHAILHRAFHALPPLTTSKGEEIGAIFGFCSMLLRVVQDLKPQYLAVAFDLPKPTFRQKIYADYQAQRPEMAQELSSQVEILHQVLEKMEIPIFEKGGYEADDVIGTLAVLAAQGPVGLHPRPMSSPAFGGAAGTRRGAPAPATPRTSDRGLRHSQELEVIIVTGDRDMLQLVDSRVKVYAPIKGITQTLLYSEKIVEEKYSLKPRQWVDFKALVGDPSDNYPGVSGIGPKGAADLLRKHGSLEEIYQNLRKLPKRQAEALVKDRKQAELAKKLAAIACDVPIKFNLDKCRFKSLDRLEVIKLFENLEFKSLIDRLKGKVGEKKKKLPKEKTKEETQLKLI